MKRTVSITAFWLLFVALIAHGPSDDRFVAADPPDPVSLLLPAEVQGDAGELVYIQAKTDSTDVRWYCPDAGLRVVPPGKLKDPREACVFSNGAGSYRVVAFVPKCDPQVCLVTIGHTPPPPPQPQPVPVVLPPVAAGTRLFVTVFIDKNISIPKVAQSKALADQIRGMGHVFTVYDDVTAPKWKAFQPYIREAGGPPAMIVQQQGSSAVKLAVKLPVDEQGVVDAVKGVK